MSYVLDLFTPETWKAFREHGSNITGFSRAHLSRARNLVRPGDIFICYLVRLSRWCGALEVIEGPFEDNSPIFKEKDDPWTVRFKVSPIVTLDEQFAIPIREQEIWSHYSRTRNLTLNSPSWPVRAALQSSLVRMGDEDGLFLFDRLRNQAKSPIEYPLSDADRRFVKGATLVPTPTGAVNVVVPDRDAESEPPPEGTLHRDGFRESICKQASIAEIGAKMGFEVWVPKNDRVAVAKLLNARSSVLIERLPLNYDNATLTTIENIDVIWLKQRRIIRAFEIEHTTAIYSGLLRMADLLALQPNIDIRLHIVAPDERRDKVLEEIQRPVFSLLEKGPLASSCSYLSYDSIEKIASEQHLSHMNDSILEEFEEYAEETRGF